jgi:hypothetical protein
MMQALKISALIGCSALVAGCAESIEGTVRPSGPAPVLAIGQDLGRDSSDLSQLEAGIFIDPDGCHIWMIDDGLEGYWSRRRDPVSGLPVCTSVAPPGSVIGDISVDPGIADRVPRTPRSR